MADPLTQLWSVFPFSQLIMWALVISLAIRMFTIMTDVFGRETKQTHVEIEVDSEDDDEEDPKSEQRIQERRQRIDAALSVRSEKTNPKLCSQCGGNFGTGTTCQYCGQP